MSFDQNDGYAASTMAPPQYQVPQYQVHKLVQPSVHVRPVKPPHPHPFSAIFAGLAIVFIMFSFYSFFAVVLGLLTGGVGAVAVYAFALAVHGRWLKKVFGL